MSNKKDDIKINNIIKNCDRLVDDINILARVLTYDKNNKKVNKDIDKFIAKSKMLNELAIKFVISQSGNTLNINEYLTYHIPLDYYSEYEKIAFSCRVILNYIKDEKDFLNINENNGIGFLKPKIFIN
jgi:hypothetical protein